MEAASGPGVKTRLAYDITSQLQAGVIYSYDYNFQSRVTGDLKWRFCGGSSKTRKSESVLAINPVIQALSATPGNRDVRVANQRRRCACQGIVRNQLMGRPVCMGTLVCS